MFFIYVYPLYISLICHCLSFCSNKYQTMFLKIVSYFWRIYMLWHSCRGGSIYSQRSTSIFSFIQVSHFLFYSCLVYWNPFTTTLVCPHRQYLSPFTFLVICLHPPSSLANFSTTLRDFPLSYSSTQVVSVFAETSGNSDKWPRHWHYVGGV